METPTTDMTADKAFTRFVKEVEPRLSYALAAAYGPEVGAEVTTGVTATPLLPPSRGIGSCGPGSVGGLSVGPSVRVVWHLDTVV